MISTEKDNRIVLTLDAGGTNFVFSAIQGNREIAGPVTFPSNAHDLDKCLTGLITGFKHLLSLLDDKPAAISFAFPGPADYEKGIIGDLPNFKAFSGGVAMGPMLEDHFGIPVFINNDGNLYAYGEALSGVLPELNAKLESTGSIHKHKNLIGITLGTGFGCGIVMDDILIVGDNSCGAEIHNSINKYRPDWNAEESVSTRAIQRVYAEQSGSDFNADLMPRDIFDIANGNKPGNKDAALEAFRSYGENLGSSIAGVLTYVDGIVVLGGGITAASELFAPTMFEELDRAYENFKGEQSARLSFRVYNLDDSSVFDEYARGKVTELKVPGSEKIVKYDSLPRTGVMFSKIGASKATSLGAYAYALQRL